MIAEMITSCIHILLIACTTVDTRGFARTHVPTAVSAGEQRHPTIRIALLGALILWLYGDVWRYRKDMSVCQNVLGCTSNRVIPKSEPTSCGGHHVHSFEWAYTRLGNQLTYSCLLEWRTTASTPHSNKHLLHSRRTSQTQYTITNHDTNHCTEDDARHSVEAAASQLGALQYYLQWLQQAQEVHEAEKSRPCSMSTLFARDVAPECNAWYHRFWYAGCSHLFRAGAGWCSGGLPCTRHVMDWKNKVSADRCEVCSRMHLTSAATCGRRGSASGPILTHLFGHRTSSSQHGQKDDIFLQAAGMRTLPILIWAYVHTSVCVRHEPLAIEQTHVNYQRHNGDCAIDASWNCHSNRLHGLQSCPRKQLNLISQPMYHSGSRNTSGGSAAANAAYSINSSNFHFVSSSLKTQVPSLRMRIAPAWIAVASVDASGFI